MARILVSAIAGLLSIGAGGHAVAQEPAPERPERIATANPPDDQAARSDVPAPNGIGTRWPGLQPDGRELLPNQWSLKPAGKQLELGDFPVHVALHPREQYAAVLHAGFGTHEVIIVDLAARQITSRVAVRQTFYGVAFDHKGKRLFVSGGEEEVIQAFNFADGLLTDHQRIPIVEPATSFVPAGITVSQDDSTLYVCGVWGHKLAVLSLDEPTAVRLVDLGKNSFPYTAVPDLTGATLYVSLWGGSAVALVNTDAGVMKGKWAVPSHPTEMVLSPDGQTLYVACANSTQVVALNTQTGQAREVLNCALYPGVPSGNTPSSLSISSDGGLLAVANADNNNLALFNVATPGAARALGFIPTGWYPTSVRFLSDGTILYANGKGIGSRANRTGPNPLVRAPGGIREYIGGLFRGTLGLIEPPNPKDLAQYTADAFQASPLQPKAAPNTKPREADCPIPAKVGQASPIEHCIYIIKENRTYDQVFGDIPEGNGEPDLCIFPEHVTPNQHTLAREFVLLDNFYVESEVSADGHEWSMGAYATDFVEKIWPLTYRGKRPKHRKLSYPSEGNFAIAEPAGGYLWDRCREAGVTYRSYGEWITNGATAADPGTARAAALEGHFDPMFRSYDLDYPDVKRAERFLEELHRFEAEGEMPSMIILRLPNDHTYGTRRGKLTPTALVADNDLALGLLVEGVSRSKFWPTTAIFVVEDDAQNGSDHVDAHRTVALVISPYCKRKFVDSSMYSTSSMLRTMELILGLQPMSQFDAAALPMYHSFTAVLDPTPYAHRPANVDLQEKNLASAWGADLSESFDLSKEDAADDLLLNEVVWRSVKGADHPMPPPVRAAFVFGGHDLEEDLRRDD